MARKNPIEQGRRAGFTIVELLIVIIIIGILATLMLLAYRGVTDQAKTATIKNDLEQIAKQLNIYKENTGGGLTYPTSGSSLQHSSATTLQYSVNSQTNPTAYCVTVTNSSISYYVTNVSNIPTSGYCSDTGAETLAWWKFNGNGTDSSGNGITAAINGATLTTGQNGTANGAYQQTESTSITVGSQAAFSNLAATGLTYSVWVNRTGTGTTSQWPNIMGGDGHVNVSIRANGYGANTYMEYASSPYTGTTFSGSAQKAQPLNSWHLLTGTYGSNTFSFYYDGTLVSQAAGTINPSTGPVNFSGWVGAIDDARVYSRALSANEIASLYSKGAQ